MVKKIVGITFISAAVLYAVGSGPLANSGVATEFSSFGGAAGTMIAHLPDLVAGFQNAANSGPAPSPAPKSAPAPGGAAAK